MHHTCLPWLCQYANKSYRNCLEMASDLVSFAHPMHFKQSVALVAANPNNAAHMLLYRRKLSITGNRATPTTVCIQRMRVLIEHHTYTFHALCRTIHAE